ncbi:hypothetical protein E2C01_084213 [Portunus trituberculatus]|uniref:Uncharacterized protein n=1 Tax=Portunus trituberculatus TaxID=210409 RepID=A0A5B7J3E8_PORTR|nr:hypothetical protein [Portunus trituberculatus]
MYTSLPDTITSVMTAPLCCETQRPYQSHSPLRVSPVVRAAWQGTAEVTRDLPPREKGGREGCSVDSLSPLNWQQQQRQQQPVGEGRADGAGVEERPCSPLGAL